MTMEVSMILRSARWRPGTRARILGCNAVEVGAKPDQVDDWGAAEHGDGGVGAYEPVTPEGSQLTDAYAVSGDDEALALVVSSFEIDVAATATAAQQQQVRLV